MNKNQELTATEQRVKNQWLTALIVCFLLRIFHEIFEFLYIYIMTYRIESSRYLIINYLIETSQLPLLINMYLLSVTFCILGSLGIYYCAYKKQGTIWLASVLLFIPLGLLLSFSEYYRHCEGIISLYFSFWLIETLIQSYFWIHCYRLFMLNRKLRKHAQSDKQEAENQEDIN